MREDERNAHGDFPHMSAPLPDAKLDRRAHRDFVKLIIALVVGYLVVAVAVACWSVRAARAFDHGFDPASPVTQFFDRLQRPYCPPGIGVCSCCGKADAYPVAIDQDATPDGDKPDGIAHVIDGSAVTYPDGTLRSFIPDGTVFRFTGRDVTKAKQGNPTRTAWAFLGVGVGGQIAIVWCVVPLPPGM
jgi:hypothetical protein